MLLGMVIVMNSSDVMYHLWWAIVANTRWRCSWLHHQGGFLHKESMEMSVDDSGHDGVIHIIICVPSQSTKALQCTKLPTRNGIGDRSCWLGTLCLWLLARLTYCISEVCIV